MTELRLVSIPRKDRQPEGPCPECGNSSYANGYCATCGSRQTEPDRDEVRLGPVSLVTDRGLEHARNEDATCAGTWSDGDGMRPRAVAVAVCDGVSTSNAPQIAAVAASNAGVDAMLAALAGAHAGHDAVLAGLTAAAEAAATAGTSTDRSNAPSCTYVAAVVTPTGQGAVQITVGNVGDSRAYWLPEPPAEGQQLTVDDSVAQELITAGAAAGSEAVQRNAHVLTRWLGADAGATPWTESSIRTMSAVGPGSLVLCTDGLWNYLPAAADITRFCTHTDSMVTARALVDHALGAGGHDNVTVAVIQIGGPHEFD